MGTVKHAAALLCAAALFASAVSLAGCSDELTGRGTDPGGALAGGLRFFEAE